MLQAEGAGERHFRMKWIRGCSRCRRRPLRVVIPNVSLHIGGGCRFLAELANGLTDLGADVVMVVPDGQPVAYPLRSRLLRVPALRPEYLPEADVALPNYWMTVDASFARYGSRCMRLSLSFEPLLIPEWELATATYRLPIPVLVISRWLKAMVWGVTGREPVDILRPGVDHSVYRPDGRAIPLTGQEPRIFAIARPASRGYAFKGNREFWQAMSIVRARHPEVRVAVVSPDGPVEEADGPYETWVAPDDHAMAECYRRSDIFVFPAWFEGFGLPLLEAMACGTPVVSADAGGVHDLVRSGENGLVVPGRSPGLLAEAVTTLLSRPEWARQLAREGQRAATAWTWSALATQTHAHLHRHVDGLRQHG